jgi:hypothetical protein
MASTLEEASRCPKCKEPGDIGARRPTAKPGFDVLGVTCQNEACKWFETGWLVQINPDGSIPEPAPEGTVRGDKQFTVEGLLKAGVTDEMVKKVNEYAQHFQTGSEINREV